MLNVRLSVMLFLQFFVFGAWYVTVGNYMAEAGMANLIYWAYTVGPIAAIVSPFFFGVVADRFFAAEKMLGVLIFLAALAMYGAAQVGGRHPLLFILLLLLHTLFYYPTIGLSHALAFHHITDGQQQFPLIRAFGSIGWIGAGVVVSGILAADKTVVPLYWAAGSAVLFALYSFTLPHTPPPARGEPVSVRRILGIDALRQLKSRSFIVFIISAMLISIPLAAYNAYGPVFLAAAGLSSPAFKMSFGVAVEVLVMFVMPLLFLRMGFKAMFLAGLAAWGLRYVLFVAAVPTVNVSMIMAGILLHGLCFDFVFVAGRIYLDRQATAAIRGQAHGFLVVVTLGIGQLLGALLSGWLFDLLPGTSAGSLEAWQPFWLVPAVFCFLVMGLFGWLFKEER